MGKPRSHAFGKVTLNPTARIMIVGEKSGALLGLDKSLENLGYTDVTQTDRGEAAVQLAGQLQTELVLMDVYLAGAMSAIQLGGQLRSRYGIPVVFFDGLAGGSDGQQPVDAFAVIAWPLAELDLAVIISDTLLRYNNSRRLIESEQKYHALFNFMAQGVVYQNASGEIISANPAAERILGLRLGQMLGRTWLDKRWKIIHEDGSDFPGDTHPVMWALKTRREVDNVVMGIYHPEKDEHVWIRVHARPQFADGASISESVVVTFEDITDIKKYQDVLSASEERYRSLVETSPEGITLTDLQGHFLAANRQALQMQGFSSFEELQASGLTSFDFAMAPAWLHDPQLLQQTMLEASPRQVEYTFCRRDGSCLPAEASLALLLDASEQPYAVLAAFRDISSKKESEAQLRKLSQAVVQSADSIVISDIQGRIEYVNPQFEQTTGYSLAEVIGQQTSLLHSAEQGQEFYQQMQQTIQSGQIWRGELHNRRKDGSLYWEEVSIAPVVDDNDVVISFVAIKKEITGRKQLEDAMRIKDSAIASSINAIALADLDGKLTYINPAFKRLWGFDDQDEVTGRSVAEFWHEQAPVGEIIQALFNSQGWQGELVAKKKNGMLFDVDTSAHLVMDELGKPLCMMSSFIDITARKQAEAAEKEEHRLAEALRQTAEALSSTLHLDDVLELIMENAGQVIANDSMTIMLLEGQKLKVARHRGFVGRGLKDYIEKNDFSIEDFPTLKAMINTRQPSIIPDVRNTPDWRPDATVNWIRSYAGVPIYRRDEVIGFLNLDSSTPNFFTPAHASRLQAFASQAGVAIENARLYEQDHILSITDGLTGLYNSRYFFEVAKREFERSQRYPGNLSVMMIDIDHFKNVNDTYGHMVGDDVLREISRRMSGCLRVVDVAARYGGEEFIILMAQTDRSEALQAAERIHNIVAAESFEVPFGQPLSLTISLGVATLSDVHENLNMLIKSADDALYRAKFAGRNQISIWQNLQS